MIFSSDTSRSEQLSRESSVWGKFICPIGKYARNHGRHGRSGTSDSTTHTHDRALGAIRSPPAGRSGANSIALTEGTSEVD